MSNVVTAWQTVYVWNTHIDALYEEIHKLGLQGYEVKGFTSYALPNIKYSLKHQQDVTSWEPVHTVIMQRASGWWDQTEPFQYPS